MNMRKIGDKVWVASQTPITKTVTCPDCFGKKYLTVIMGDDSQVTIDCAGCASDYDPPKGYIKYYSWTPEPRLVTITKIEVTKDGATYSHSQNHYSKETDLFDSKEEALKRCEERATEHEKEELEKIHRKEKNNRTWAWNAHYHRDCIKKAEKELAYHTAKLNAAKEKLK